jgi:checkpoint serine/threonine-protein kinase
MTMHTKAATDDIYEIFNQPLKTTVEEEQGAPSESEYETDGDYTSGAESTGTTRQLTASEAGDEEDEDVDDVDGIAAEMDAESISDVKSVSEWSDFSTRKHVPNIEELQVEDEHHTAEVTQPDLIQIDEALDDVPSTISDKEGDENAAEAEAEEEDDEEMEAITPVFQELPKPRTTFIPIPPVDYVPPSRPYRDPAEVANNRLPFMTPITERTESSLEFEDDFCEQRAMAKTPSKTNDAFTAAKNSIKTLDFSPMSSPLIEIVDQPPPPPKIAQPLLKKALVAKQPPPAKGPIIGDAQCNPVDELVRAEILEHMQPPLSSYSGFYDRRSERYEKGHEIRKYAKAATAMRTGKRRASSIGAPPAVQFTDTGAEYVIRRELGAGAFAPVYLVENSQPSTEEDADGEVAMGRGAFATPSMARAPFEALKMEQPPTAWEFHMMRLVHARLGPHHRAAASMSPALECHLFADETFLFLPYYPHGTLLDVINLFRGDGPGVMDETLAMFFAVELLRSVEALHAHGILHGDLKADNCLLRLDALSEWAPESGQLASQWRADGSGGWGARGLVLIDFGRAIDMRSFRPDVAFVADWKTTQQDCAEMREGRPWTWQIDYHGLAGVLHTLLFGRYMETVRAEAGALGTARRYKIRENLKRYWQTDLWGEAFDLLLNPAGAAVNEDGARMPVLRSMRRVRERMEAWLEENCERGVGLKSLMAKVEAGASKRK